MWFYIEKCETMEKLLELMNDYAHTYADYYDDTWAEIEIKFLEHTDNCFIYYCDWSFDSLVDDVIISKRFGFIGWLIKNNKIDYHNKINYDISLAIHRVPKKTTREERLLMMLSIQDEPINFLISILK